MPSSQSGERRLIKYPSMPGAPSSDQDQQNPLPCPRCDSPNTKFCYYNNYNLAQPRHFCKSCRRYWTQGGTLRNVPVGGGTRKNAKRSRISSSPLSEEDPIISPNPISSRPIPTSTPVTSLPLIRSDVNLNIVNINASGGGFTSLLNGQTPGFLALNGFGLGITSGFEEMGFEIGKGVWPLGLPDVSETTNNIGGSGSGGAGVGVGMGGGVGGGNTWQLGVGADGGFGENECFTWPELGISTPRRSVK